jgi:hypothetical protein
MGRISSGFFVYRTCDVSRSTTIADWDRRRNLAGSGAGRAITFCGGGSSNRGGEENLVRVEKPAKTGTSRSRATMG